MLLTGGLWGRRRNSVPHASHPLWTSRYVSLMVVAEPQKSKQTHVITLKA